MNQKSLSKMLRAICIVCAVLILFLCVYAYYRIDEYVGGKGELLRLASHIAVFSCMFMVDVALFLAWQIFGDIGKNLSFTELNAKRLAKIALIFLFDSAVFIIGLIIYAFLGIGEYGLYAFMLVVLFVGISLAAIAACLSHLVGKAAKIEEENELTI